MHGALARALEERIERGEQRRAHHRPGGAPLGRGRRPAAGARRRGARRARGRAGERVRRGAGAASSARSGSGSACDEPEQLAGIERGRAAHARPASGGRPGRRPGAPGGAAAARARAGRRRTRDPRRAALLLERLSQSLWSQHRQDECVETLQRGPGAAARTTSRARERAALLSQLAKQRMLQSRFAEAAESAREALEVARAVGDREAEAHRPERARHGARRPRRGRRGRRLPARVARDRARARLAEGGGRRVDQPRGRPHLDGRTEEALEVARAGPRGRLTRPWRTATGCGWRVSEFSFHLGDWEEARGGHPGRQPPPHAAAASSTGSICRARARARPRRPEAARRGARRAGARPRASRPSRSSSARTACMRAELRAPQRRHRRRARRDRRRARPDRVLLRRHRPHRGARGGRACAWRPTPASWRATAATRTPSRRARRAPTRSSSARAWRPRPAGGGGGRSWPPPRPSTRARRADEAAASGRAAAERWEALGAALSGGLRALARGRGADGRARPRRRRAGGVGGARGGAPARQRAGWSEEVESLAARARLQLGERRRARRRGRDEREAEDPFGLTARERDVLALVAGGRHQPRDRRAPPHGREDGQRARVAHPGRSSTCARAPRRPRWRTGRAWCRRADPSPPARGAVMLSRLVELRAATASLALAEEFGIARGSRTTQSVVQVELEHDGIVGRGEAAPVYYRGESIESAAEFLTHAAPPLARRRPLRARGHRGAARGRGRRGGRQGRARRRAARLDRPAARRAASGGCSGSRPRRRPPRSRSASTPSRARATAPAGRARFRALKVKVGGAEDLERLEAVRDESDAPLRVDANEGWTLEPARELMPDADPAGRGVRRAAVPRRRPRLLPRAARARPAPARDRRRGLPGPARRRAGRGATPTASTSSSRSPGACARLCG